MNVYYASRVSVELVRDVDILICGSVVIRYLRIYIARELLDNYYFLRYRRSPLHPSQTVGAATSEILIGAKVRLQASESRKNRKSSYTLR